MTFYTVPFFVFFLCLIIALRYTKNIKQQNIILLIANFIFYIYWDVQLFFLILLEGIIVYTFGIAMGREKKRKYIVIPVVCLISLLGYFKYCNFFVESFSTVFPALKGVSLQIVLPLGISFYTFQAISYLFDVYYNKIPPEKDFVKLSVYISFFPTIISGPIVKAKDFLPQLNSVHRINWKQVTDGIQIFVLGLLKKVVIADRIGVAVNAVYATPTAYNGISVLMAIIGYSVQIYCDFSGYSDMAIGVAKIMGFDLGRNFNLPYLAQNPTEFWRRWHISLSTWFRDYLYIPLGGNRKGKVCTYINLFITMVASGIWHGANITYLVWGCCHGIATIVHKIFIEITKRKRWSVERDGVKKLLKCLSVVSNNLFVSLLWVVFRANSLAEAKTILSSVFSIDGILYINPFVLVFVLLVACAHIYAERKNAGQGHYIILNLEKFSSKIVFFVVILLIFAIMYVGDSAFIYAQF